MFRALGWLLLAMAVAAVVHDGLAWWTEGSFHLLGLGDLWSHLDTRSLADAQSAVQRRVCAARVFARNSLVMPIARAAAGRAVPSAMRSPRSTSIRSCGAG